MSDIPNLDRYRVNANAERDRMVEYIKELEDALKRIAKPDPDDTVENLVYIAREVLYDR